MEGPVNHAKGQEGVQWVGKGRGLEAFAVVGGWGVPVCAGRDAGGPRVEGACEEGVEDLVEER